MWITKIRAKHDCVIGNRCEKFGVTTIGTPFSVFQEKGVTYAPQIQTVHGDGAQIKKFVADLKKDERIREFEVEGNTVFFIEIRKEKIPSSFYNPKLIHVKPVFVDAKGYEFWEVASWDRKVLTDFIANLEKNIDFAEVLKLEKTKLEDIYFSRLMPRLSGHQKRAVELAFENGFYRWPKKTNFIKLARLMKVSVPTFREHLKRAEEKLMPDLMRLVE
ncbi:MAG: helix-turn-helix domain-containing protein [Candidatus Nanoarchaeia archaeon]|nr:helix-turn-helix domain-containing protein [Candidatus Nanoarchaeia archaeon]